MLLIKIKKYNIMIKIIKIHFLDKIYFYVEKK